jgi:hypothetical protein
MSSTPSKQSFFHGDSKSVVEACSSFGEKGEGKLVGGETEGEGFLLDILKNLKSVN